MQFTNTIRNTLMISLYSLATFPIPVMLALMVNQMREAVQKAFPDRFVHASFYFNCRYGWVNAMSVMEPEAITKTPRAKSRPPITVADAVLFTFAVLFPIAVLYPIYFIVIASFSDPSAVANGQVWVFPKGFTLEGYKELLRHENIWIGYRNTILYTGVGTLFGLIINISAAYALSRKDLVGRKFFSLFFIFTMFFSGGLIPTFLTIRDFHLYNTFLVMVLPFSAL